MKNLLITVSLIAVSLFSIPSASAQQTTQKQPEVSQPKQGKRVNLKHKLKHSPLLKKKLVELADTNGDNKLNKSERKGVVSIWRSQKEEIRSDVKETRTEKKAARFNRIDKNDDGKLSRREKAHSKLKPKVARPKVKNCRKHTHKSRQRRR